MGLLASDSKILSFLVISMIYLFGFEFAVITKFFFKTENPIGSLFFMTFNTAVGLYIFFVDGMYSDLTFMLCLTFFLKAVLHLINAFIGFKSKNFL